MISDTTAVIFSIVLVALVVFCSWLLHYRREFLLPKIYLAVAVSYAVSGYYGLYKDQTIVYSKYKAKYINRHTRF